MIPFIRNNIELREVTSRSLADFLMSKSYMLGEVSARTHHTFSRTSKEILLQSYRIWTDWLFGLEELCIAMDSVEFDEDALEHAIGLAKMKNKELKDLFESNEDDFDPKFTSVWVKLQEFRRPYSRFELASALKGRRLSSAYKEVTLWLITYMNHLLFNLHEIDYMLYHEKGDTYRPFVYVDNADISFYVSSKVSVLERLNLYKSEGILDKSDLILKMTATAEELGPTRNSSALAMLNDMKNQGFNFTLT